MLQSFHIANCRLVEQILKCATILKAAAHLRHKFVGYVHSKTVALDSPIKNMAGVLITSEASFAVLPDASRAAKAQRSESGGPKAGSLLLKPMSNICGKVLFCWHAVYVTYYHMYSQVKSVNFFTCSKL